MHLLPPYMVQGQQANGGMFVHYKNRAVPGKLLSYSGRFSTSEKPQNKFNFMNASEKIDFERSLFSDFKDQMVVRGGSHFKCSGKRNITEQEGESQIAELGQTNTNWMDEVMQQAFSQSHVLSLSGGNDKTQYYSSLNYSKANGVLKTNNYDNAGLNIKLSNYSAQKFTGKI